jgi:hypothetical protein
MLARLRAEALGHAAAVPPRFPAAPPVAPPNYATANAPYTWDDFVALEDDDLASPARMTRSFGRRASMGWEVPLAKLWG